MTDYVSKDYSQYGKGGRLQPWVPEANIPKTARQPEVSPGLVGNTYDIEQSVRGLRGIQSENTSYLLADKGVISGGLGPSLAIDTVTGAIAKQLEGNGDARKADIRKDNPEASDSRASLSTPVDSELLRSLDQFAQRADKLLTGVGGNSTSDVLRNIDKSTGPPLPQEQISSNSPDSVNNRLGALARLSDDGSVSDGQAAAWADMVKTKTISSEDLDKVSGLSGRKFIDMISENNPAITRDQAVESVAAQQDNKEVAARYGLEATIQRSHAESANNLALGAGQHDGPFNQSTLKNIQDIMAEGDWADVSRKVSGAMASSVLDMSDESLHDVDKRNSAMGSAARDVIKEQATTDNQFAELGDRLNSLGDGKRDFYLTQMADDAANLSELGKADVPITKPLQDKTADILGDSGSVDTADKDAPTNELDMRSLLETNVDLPDSMSLDSFTKDKVQAGNQPLDRDNLAPTAGSDEAKTVVLRGATINVTSEDASIQLTGVDSGPASEATPTAPAVTG